MWDWVCRIGINIYFLANSFGTYDYVVFLCFVPYNIENSPILFVRCLYYKAKLIYTALQGVSSLL